MLEKIQTYIPKNQPLSKNNAINSAPSFKAATKPITNVSYIPNNHTVNIVTTLTTQEDRKKYEFLLNFMKNYPVSKNSNNKSASHQLEELLKSGKLLSASSNDKSTVLDNLYKIATQKRNYDFNQQLLISNTLDILCSPAIITQTFGDIPPEVKTQFVNYLDSNHDAKKNPSLMDVKNSGTCAAASCEVNLADKYPAEFARWVNELTTGSGEIVSKINLSAISKNILEATNIINIMKANKRNYNLKTVDIVIKTDKNAYLRAKNQEANWDLGERNVVDVLIQSAIMQTGSQNTYDSLTDTRKGDFNPNSQGLIEIEKTFVESLIKNKEITSLVYQKIDQNQNLIGYNCSLDKIKKHIIDTIDSGDDVILGYVLTNETSGKTASGLYSKSVDGAPNKVINGHEITVVGYTTNQAGYTTFICVDTDDDSKELVMYGEDWLLPKIHHAGYLAEIVAADADEIIKNELSNIA